MFEDYTYLSKQPKFASIGNDNLTISVKQKNNKPQLFSEDWSD